MDAPWDEAMRSITKWSIKMCCKNVSESLSCYSGSGPSFRMDYKFLKTVCFPTVSTSSWRGCEHTHTPPGDQVHQCKSGLCHKVPLLVLPGGELVTSHALWLTCPTLTPTKALPTDPLSTWPPQGCHASCLGPVGTRNLLPIHTPLHAAILCLLLSDHPEMPSEAT